MAGDGYTVRVTALQAGGRQTASLQDDCEQVAGGLAVRLEALAVAAGSPAVRAGARQALKAVARQFLGAAAGYEHASQSLAQTAASYARAEESSASSAHGAASGMTGR